MKQMLFEYSTVDMTLTRRYCVLPFAAEFPSTGPVPHPGTHRCSCQWRRATKTLAVHRSQLHFPDIPCTSSPSPCPAPRSYRRRTPPRTEDKLFFCAFSFVSSLSCRSCRRRSLARKDHRNHS